MTGTTSTLVGLCLAALCATLVVMDSRNHPSQEVKSWQPEEDSPVARRLNKISRGVLGRIEQKTEVIRQVVDGQMTLLAAVSWFRHYHETATQEIQGHIEDMPGDTLDEKYCAQVFMWVHQVLSNAGTSQKIEVWSRLECERAAARQQGNGSLHLPES